MSAIMKQLRLKQIDEKSHKLNSKKKKYKKDYLQHSLRDIAAKKIGFRRSYEEKTMVHKDRSSKAWQATSTQRL